MADHFFLGWLMCSFALCDLNLARAALNVQILAPGFVNTPMPSTITLCGPAFATGVDYLNRIYAPDMNVTLAYVYDSNFGNCASFTDETVNMVSRWLYEKRDPKSLTVIITPSCAMDPIVMMQVATQWNILLITSTQSDLMMRNKVLAPTWITTNVYPAQHYGTAMLSLMQTHKWTSIFVAEEDGPLAFYNSVGSIVKRDLQANNIQHVYFKYKAGDSALDFGQFLREFHRKSRVMIFLGPAESLRILLIQAHSRDMANHEFVYIAFTPFPYKRYGTFTWNKGDDDDSIVRQAYRSVLLFMAIDLSQDTSANLTSMTAVWTALYRSDPFYRNQDMQDDPPVPFLAGTQAALEMLAQVLNETLTTDPTFDLQNGAALAQQFWNRTFDTTTGRVSLDQYGDRFPITSLSSFDGSKLEVLARSNFRTGSFQWEYLRNISWYGGSQLPLNEPYCGYDGHSWRCLAVKSGRDTLEIALIVVASTLGLGLAPLLYIYCTRWRNNPNSCWFLLDNALMKLRTTGKDNSFSRADCSLIVARRYQSGIPTYGR
ncbi:putative Atrial natriuretic peptide receptor 3 [Hypsibius exemplaris]|uniref:Atrial natriuretic peptide receptor 3 n=1 Tax=Hypsibius exemplaris TaxID=2072580 RepID=A0A1W0WH97_HYPEX|nr:putative Atrial natriuretic peptide receptor 3 [Hypsibius exemplaris]